MRGQVVNARTRDKTCARVYNSYVRIYEPNIEPNIEPYIEPNIEPNMEPNEPNIEPINEPKFLGSAEKYHTQIF